MNSRRKMVGTACGFGVVLMASTVTAGDLVWTEDVVEQMPITHVGFTAVEIRTHNGTAGFRAAAGEPYVIVTKRAGGWTKGAADRALDAIEIVVEEDGDTFKIGWKWGKEQRKSWQAVVSFEIHAPGSVEIEAKTHNGGVDIVGAENEVEVETHNGGVRVQSSGEVLDIEAHNGAISAAFSGAKLKLQTHNGAVEVDLANCGEVKGSITTHNGSVAVFVGGNTSTDIRCQTHGGAITSNASLAKESVSERKLSGRVGDGGGKLKIKTHNGSVSIGRAG